MLIELPYSLSKEGYFIVDGIGELGLAGGAINEVSRLKLSTTSQKSKQESGADVAKNQSIGATILTANHSGSLAFSRTTALS
jgi:hypothetical protein